MKLWMGVLLAFVGGAMLLFGYAPLLTPAVSSIELIVAGGLVMAAGISIIILVSGRRIDTSDLEEQIRP